MAHASIKIKVPTSKHDRIEKYFWIQKKQKSNF